MSGTRDHFGNRTDPRLLHISVDAPPATRVRGDGLRMVRLGALALMSIMAGVALALMTGGTDKEPPEMTSQAIEAGNPSPAGETAKARSPHIISYRQDKQ